MYYNLRILNSMHLLLTISSTSLIVWEMQNKATMRNHLTRVRMAIIRKKANDKRCKYVERKGTLMHCWWECKLVQREQLVNCKLVL